MNELFEEFIYRLIYKNIDFINSMSNIKIGLPVYQNREPLIDCSLKFDLENITSPIECNRSFGQTFTDILLPLEDGKIIILDTKYKINSGNRSDFKNADIYQMLAYKEIHKNHNPEAVLLYPQEENDFAWIHFVQGNNKVHLTCVDLRINLKEETHKILEKIAQIINWTTEKRI